MLEVAVYDIMMGQLWKDVGDGGRWREKSRDADRRRVAF